MAKEYGDLLGTWRQTLPADYFKHVLPQGDNGRELSWDTAGSCGNSSHHHHDGSLVRHSNSEGGKKWT